jgi:hypothetical protein
MVEVIGLVRHHPGGGRPMGAIRADRAVISAGDVFALVYDV